MVGTATEPATARILVISVAGGMSDELTRSLRRQRLAVTYGQTDAAGAPFDGGVAAAVICAPDFGDEVRAAARRFRAAHPRVPLALWAAHDPMELIDVLEAGFTFWVPAEVPASTVAVQMDTLSRLLEGKSPAPDTVMVRNIAIDLQRCEVTISGRPLALTPTEFRIIAHLAGKPGRVVSHAELFREVHGYDASDQEAKDILKVHIWRLRTKLAAAGVAGDLIVNVRGFGYLLERRASGAARDATNGANG